MHLIAVILLGPEYNSSYLDSIQSRNYDQLTKVHKIWLVLCDVWLIRLADIPTEESCNKNVNLNQTDTDTDTDTHTDLNWGSLSTVKQ